MKNIAQIIFLLSITLSNYSCWDHCEGICPDLPPMDTTNIGNKDSLPYELIWQTPLHSDTLFSVEPYFYPIIYKNQIIMSRHHGWGINVKIQSFDRLSGMPLWVWDDFFKQPQDLSDGPHVSNNKLFTTSGRGVFSINMDDGSTIFKSEIPDNLSDGRKISITHDLLFHEVSYKNPLVKTVLRKYNSNNSNWEDIFSSMSKDDDDFVKLRPPSGWINTNGDTILVFHERWNRNNPPSLNVILYSYNMTKQKLLWADTLKGTSSVVEPPFIEEGLIYFQMQEAMHCIDKYTGEQIWVASRYNVSGGFQTSNFIVTENRVFMHSSVGTLVSIDKSTGTILYTIKVGGAGEHITYSNGRLYIISGDLFIIDALSGRILYQLDTHNYSRRTPGSFTNGVAIDEENGLLYAQDGFFAMCFKVPE